MDILRNVNLATYNTLGLRVHADYFCELTTRADVLQALEFTRSQNLALTLLGGGSNVLIAEPLAGLTAHMALRGREVLVEQNDTVQVKFGAGENWHDTVNYCLQQNWYGLENLSLIPGTVGAAPIQNIGAYGVELKQCFVALEAIAIASGKLVTFNREECQFGYRDSIFKGSARGRYVIISVTLALSKTPNTKLDYPALRAELCVESREELGKEISVREITPQQVAAAVCRIRRQKLPDPAEIPNAGSFFKNPLLPSEQAEDLQQQFPEIITYPQADGQVKLAAGWLIEQAGWKGVQRDGVGVHQHQALVLINTQEHAEVSGGTLLGLAREIQADIYQKFGVNLEMEPVVLGL